MDEEGGHSHQIRRQSGRNELLDELLGRHQHLAAHVAAFFGGGQLVLKMDPRDARFDHGFHQFEGVQGAAKAGFRIRHDRGEPVGPRATLRMLDLIGPLERIVDSAHHVGDTVGRVEALVRIHLAGVVGIGRHLPATEINGRESGLDLLDRLIAGQGAQGRHIRLGVQQMPQPLGSHFGQGVLDLDGAAEPDDIIRRVRPRDPLPSRVSGPLFRKFCCLKIVLHVSSPLERSIEQFQENAPANQKCGSGVGSDQLVPGGEPHAGGDRGILRFHPLGPSAMRKAFPALGPVFNILNSYSIQCTS